MGRRALPRIEPRPDGEGSPAGPARKLRRSYDRPVTSPRAGRELTVGIGAAAGGLGSPDDILLDLGPHHPSTHGALRLRLRLEAERIVACEPDVGYLHRGVEKLFEVRDYRQIVVLANRHDWLSAFAN